MKSQLLKLIAIILFILAGASALSQETDGFILRGKTLNSIGFSSSGNGIIVGDNGASYYTVNSGETWSLSNSGTLENLNKISLATAGIVLAAGNNGTLLKSNDMGASWEDIQVHPGNKITGNGNFLSVSLLASGKGIICGINGTLMMTTDFGVSWVDLFGRKNVDLLSVAMFDDNKGILTGSNSTILYTTNGGANWNVPGSSLAVQVNYNYVVMTSATTAYAVTSKGHIVKSTDTGNSWQIVYEDPQQVPLTRIEIIPGGSAVVAIGNSGKLLISKDAGVTWQTQNTGTTYDLNCIGFCDSRIGFIGGKNGILLKTVDGGLKWSQVDYLPFAKKGNGDISKVPETGFALNQNYPNPFNPSTTISFNIPNEAKVALKIFDINGREITGKELGVMQAGVHTFTFNASALSSGIYFYKITASTNSKVYSKTMRMILTK